MQKITSAVIALLLVFGIQDLRAEGIEFEHGSWEEALQKAQKEDKFIFVDCMTSWCGPCKWMAATIMTQPKVASFYNENFINVKLDMEKGDGKILANDFGISTYPTLAFFNGAGEIIWRVAGAREADDFVALGQKVLDGVEPIQKIYDKFASGDYDRDFLYQYLVHADEAGMNYRKAMDEYKKEMKPGDLAKDQEFDVFMRFFWNTESEYYAEFENNLETYKKNHDAEKVEEKYYGCWLRAMGQAVYKNEQEKVELAIEKIGDGGGEWVQSAVMGQMIHNTMTNASKKEGYALISEYLDQGKKVDPMTLNNHAWGIYESEDDPKLVKEGLRWAEIAGKETGESAVLDTWGMLLYKSGNLEEAVVKLEESIHLGKEAGEDVTESEKALIKIKGELKK